MKGQYNTFSKKKVKPLDHIFQRVAITYVFLMGWLFPGVTFALTANRVWYEIHPRVIRVYVSYTIPEIKETREAFSEFKDPKKASRFYWDLVRGAEFYLNSSERIRFKNPSGQPDPW